MEFGCIGRGDPYILNGCPVDHKVVIIHPPGCLAHHTTPCLAVHGPDIQDLPSKVYKQWLVTAHRDS